MRTLPGEALARLLSALDGPGAASSDFDLNPGFQPPPGRVLRPAAVLVPVLTAGEGAMVLTKRSSRLQHHPGQVAFPGGKVDAGDASIEAAALREAEEEIGLSPAGVELRGRLPAHETVTNFLVTPVLGLIHADFAPLLQQDEVAEVFRVPLPHLLDPEHFRVERRMWRGTSRAYYTVPWGPYYIWGATARILYGLARRAAG